MMARAKYALEGFALGMACLVVGVMIGSLL